MIFSKRLELSEKVKNFIMEHGIVNDAFGAICALEIMGRLKDDPPPFDSTIRGIPHHDCKMKFSPLDDCLICVVCGRHEKCTHPRGYYDKNGRQVCAICDETINDLHYQWGQHHWGVENKGGDCHLFRDGERMFKIHENITTLAQLRLVVKGWEHRNGRT